MTDEGAPKEDTGGDDNGDLPAIDFSTFVLSLSHSAFVHLGDAPDPEGARHANLPLARQTIDLLSLLQDKTRGNLTGPEERVLTQVLYEVRSRYLEVARTK